MNKNLKALVKTLNDCWNDGQIKEGFSMNFTDKVKDGKKIKVTEYFVKLRPVINDTEDLETLKFVAREQKGSYTEPSEE